MTQEMSGSAVTTQTDRLTELLWELRRIAHAKRELSASYEATKAEALGYLEAVGSQPVADPYTGEHLVAAPRRDEVLHVDLDLLAERLGPGVAAAVSKPAQVDVARFEEAVVRGIIPAHVAAEVATYRPKAAFVAFTKPDDEG